MPSLFISLLQQLVNFLKIVERVVEEEAEVGDYSDLTLYPVAKFKSDLAFLFVYAFKYLHSFFRREDGDMCSADTEVGTYFDVCNA